VSGYFGTDAASVAATWVAAVATLLVLGGLVGERRLFGWTQHLFAGLLTGFLALIALTEVIVPWLIEPLMGDPIGHPALWLGLALVVSAASAPWLPRTVSAVPMSLAIGALAAFAIGGAVIGTLLPQLLVAVPRHAETTLATAISVASAIVTAVVAFAFVHGVPRGRIGGSVARGGRWLLLAGIGGWLGYLLLSRLVLLVDRISFLLGDWLGIGR
jgi:hypothetical protein